MHCINVQILDLFLPILNSKKQFGHLFLGMSENQ